MVNQDMEVQMGVIQPTILLLQLHFHGMISTVNILFYWNFGCVKCNLLAIALRKVLLALQVLKNVARISRSTKRGGAWEGPKVFAPSSFVS
jgi:hypothetical protein